MKLRKILMGLAAVVGFTTAAQAATPVAVFEGESLNGGTSGGYTLTLNGNAYADGAITIANDATKGVQVTPPDHKQTTVSILVRYSSLDQSTASGNPVFVSTSQGKNNATEFADVGIWASTTQFVGFWKDNGTYGPLTYSASAAGYMLFTSSLAENNGVRGYFGTKSGDSWTWSDRIGADGLRFTGAERYYDNFAIGGPNGTGANATSKPAFKGLKIEGIAIFNSRLTTADAEEYKFPSEIKEVTIDVSDDKSWSVMIGEAGIEDPSVIDLTVNVTGIPTITLDDATKFKSITFTGTPEFKADDIYEDGCWIKTLLEAETLTVPEGATYADIEAGFVGAYEATATAITLRAQNREVISINIGGGRNGGSGMDADENYLVPSNETYYGLAPVKGETWNNINWKWKATTLQEVTLKGSIAAAEDGSIVDRPTIDLSAKAKETYSYDCNQPYLSGYLDDGLGVTVSVHGVPYSEYDVIVYSTSDSSLALAPVTVNGTKYTYEDGATVEGDTSWGVGQYKDPAFGKNALYISGLTGEELSIVATRMLDEKGNPTGPRATICAVQVINKGEVSIVSDYVADVTGDVTWTDGKDANLTPYGDAWANGQLSTLTLTNTVASSFAFNAETFGQKFKVVSEDGSAMAIPASCFENISFSMTDFTEALGKVTVDMDGFEGVQTVLATTMSGYENVEFVNVAENYVAYADATGIHLADEVNTTRQNPITGDDVEFTYFFDGAADGDWENLANWRKNLNGASVPFADSTIAPGLRGSVFGSLLFDGDQMAIEPEEGYKCVTADGDPMVDGWVAQYGFYNGVKVTAGHLYGVTSSGQVLNYYVDGTSKFVVEDGPDTNYGSPRTLNMWVASKDGVEFTGKKYSVSGTINYYFAEGGSVKFDKGISAATHNLTGGQLIVGGDGFTGGALNVTNKAAVAFMSDATLGATTTVREDSTLTLDPNGSALTVTGAITCDGEIVVKDGSLEGTGSVFFKPSAGVDYTKVTVTSGKAIFGFTVTINDCGEFALPTGLTADQVRLFDADGNEVKATFNAETGKFEFDWAITGEACWWDYEFNGDLKSAGTDTTALAGELTNPYFNAASNALMVGYSTSYRGASYDAEFTAVFRAKIVNNQKHVEMGFGSSTGGTKKSVAIACGDPAKEEVVLLVSDGGTVKKTVTMTVPNAYTADHLYAFVCKTVGGNTKVVVYLDGKEWDSYTFDGTVTLGGGFQIGSVHGGVPGGYTKATTANKNAELDFLRVYNTVLNQAAMTKYAETYPYISENGQSYRTFAGDASWAEAEGGEQWDITLFDKSTYSTNVALAGSVVAIDATEASTVTMNLDAATTYESLTVGGEITLVAGEDAVKPTVTGLTSIEGNVTVAYDAIAIGKVNVTDDNTLTFDFTDFPFDTYFTDTTIGFTGAASGEITASGLPTEGTRTATFVKNASDHYELKITVDKTVPFVYESGAWAFDGSDATIENVNAATANPVVMNGEEGDAETVTVAARTVTVNGGTIKANDKGTGTITVNGGATFDINGKPDTGWTLVLNGGSLVNSGTAVTTGSKQYASITQTAASTIGGEAEFGYILQGWGANTLDLGGETLTKAGTNVFSLCNCTVTNGTLAVTAGTLKISNKAVTFASDASLTLGEGTTLDVAAPLEIAAIAADGATISNAGTISPFTLTGSATLAGDGTWGTNTLDGATATIGQKRGLVFNGEGTVNVTLTEEEYNGELPITLFAQGETGASEIGTVIYNDQDITEKCTKSGNQITAIEKAPAVPEWIDPDDWENVQKYNTWALAYGVTDPNAAIKDAFLFNIENNEMAVELAKERFVIHGITVDSDGTVTIEPPNEADIGVEFFNGKVNVRGSATVDGEYLLPQEDPDARFFKAFLELISSN